MIKIENVEIVGWEAAIRGMRNPMNSWDKSDSEMKYENIRDSTGYLDIGPKDHDLMMRLIQGGDDHGKVARYLDVYVDITAPLYFWKEFRTYRKGRKFMDDGDDFSDPDALEMFIETNSCSTMHKIHEKEFTIEDFSHEHLFDDVEGIDWYYDTLVGVIDTLNIARESYLASKEKRYWWQMIQLLPSSYNQKRTVKLNYQVLRNMYHARKNHKLDEWRDFCKWIESLPYSELITGEEANA